MTPKNTTKSQAPAIENNIRFQDIFNLDDLQRLQNLFSDATGVASIITHPDGTPITKPSNFCRLCSSIIRKTEKGLSNCFHSDAAIGRQHPSGPIVEKCLSGGLWDAGASITIGGKHIANWLIGQVRNEDLDENKMISYADEIGADKKEFMEALKEVPEMSVDRFKNVSQMLFAFVNEISEKAFQNYQLKAQIAERDKAYRLLNKSEERYSAIFENVQDVFYQTDLKGIIQEISPSIKYFSEYKRDEIIGTNVSGLYFNPNDRNILLDRLSKTGELLDYEIALKTKTGRVKHVSTNARLAFDNKGMPTHINGALRDITDRINAVETIQLAKQSYVDIFNSVSEAIYIQDETGTFIDVNLGAEKMYGYSRNFLIGKTPVDVAAPGLNDLQKIQRMIQGVFETGIPARFDFWAVRKNGEVFPKEIITNKGKYFDKDVLITTARDISQQKQNETLILESEEKYRLLAENATDVIWTMDISGKYHYVSPSVFALRGVTAEENMKETMLDCLTPESAKYAYELHKKYSKRILKGERSEPVTIELEQLCKNGATVWTEINMSAIYDDHQKFKYFLGVTRDISKRRRTEEALRESEKRKKDILRAIPDLLFLFDRKGDYLEVISGDNANLVVDKEELIGKNIGDVFPKDITKEALSAIEKCFMKKAEGEFSYSLDLNGNKHFYEARLLKASDNKVLAIVRDITNLKIIEANRDKQLLYTKALNEVAEIIISNDNAEEILEGTNAIVGRTLQLDRSLIYNVSFEKNIITGLSEWLRTEHPDIEATKGEYSMDMFRSPFTEILKTKNYLVSHFNKIGEFYQKDDSGKILHEHFKIKSLIWYPFFFQKNEYYIFTLNQILEARQWTQDEFGFLESVTKQVTLALIKIQLLSERQHAEQSMKNSYDLLNGVAAQVPGVVYQYRIYPDGHSAFPYASPGIWDIYEVTPDEVKNDASLVFSRIHPDDFSRVSETINESARNQSLYHEEFRVLLPEQGLQWRLCDAKPELLDDGSTLWHGIVTDISDRKNAEEELIKAKEKAEESDRLKTAFLANMSHEIRTPMNGILGFTSLLQQPNLTVEKQQKYLDIIKKSGGRMLNTVNDIIDISRIEANLVELVLSEVDIDVQLKELHSFFVPEAAKKGIQLILKNDISDQNNKLITDPEKFNSILTNLIKNAIKFTEKGFIEFGYHLKKETYTNDLLFYVKDSGIGIPKDRQHAIFDRFVQADIEDKMAVQGSGLGLAISKAYAEMLEGKLWLESEEGIGSTFYFTLGNRPETKPKSLVSKKGQIVEKNGIEGKLNILIVEDDEASQQLISILVEKFTRKIAIVTTGIEAVEACQNNPDIDFILMDIQLPDMNGYEATQKIRQFNKEVVIFAQTAYALTGDKEKTIEMGCNDYISKPIDESELDALIKKYTKKYPSLKND